MTISIHQPAYNPWLGYFDKIQHSDSFIFLDSVQFEKNSFINRNKIKTPNGLLWLTVPVKTKDYKTKSIGEIEIDYSRDWIKSHLRAIEINYAKSINFEKIYSFWKEHLEEKEPFLADLCYKQLLGLNKLLNINKPIIRSSKLENKGKKSELILNLCVAQRATEYISGVNGKEYLDVEEFNNRGINVKFQNFISPNYNQLYGTFIPNLGILDFLMNNQI